MSSYTIGDFCSFVLFSLFVLFLFESFVVVSFFVTQVAWVDFPDGILVWLVNVLA